jgi:hypothetical protein
MMIYLRKVTVGAERCGRVYTVGLMDDSVMIRLFIFSDGTNGAGKGEGIILWGFIGGCGGLLTLKSLHSNPTG